jgi:hypothetical protein
MQRPNAVKQLHEQTGAGYMNREKGFRKVKR